MDRGIPVVRERAAAREERQVSGPLSARFLAAWLMPEAVARAAEIAAARERAERLGIHDESLRLARTTLHDYVYWVDHLAIAANPDGPVSGP